MILPRIFLLLAMGIPVIATAEEQMADDAFNQVLDKMEKTLSGVKTLRTEFEQDKRMAVFDQSLKAKGRLLFESPHKVRFEITEPFRSVLIVNDRNVAKYTWTRKTGWRKLRLHSTDALQLVMNQIADWMQGKFRAQSHMFALHGQRSGKQEFIVLTPKPKALKSVIARIEILLDEERTRISAITICEPGSDSTVLSFRTEKRNEGLAAGTFDTHRQEPVDTAETKP